MDEKMREALMKLANGYTYEEKTVFAGRNGKPDRIKVTVKHVPPSIKAIEKIEFFKHMGQW